jgi:hypothetical protein
VDGDAEEGDDKKNQPRKKYLCFVGKLFVTDGWKREEKTMDVEFGEEQEERKARPWPRGVQQNSGVHS